MEEDLRNISLDKGLEIVETTIERNGHPLHLIDAVIGFEDFEQAKEFADEHGLELIWLDKRDGWNLWHRGNNAYEPMKLRPEVELENFIVYGKDDCQSVIDDMRSELLSVDHLSQLTSLICRYNEIVEEIKDLDDGEVALVDEGCYYGKTKLEVVHWHEPFDNKVTTLGAISL